MPSRKFSIHTPGEEIGIASLLLNYFFEKVARIRAAIDQRIEVISADQLFYGKALSRLHPVSIVEVKKTLDSKTGNSSPAATYSPV